MGMTYTFFMAVALLREPLLTLPTEVGPYRRQDYEALPDEPRCELIFGRFYWSPSPSVPHQVVVGITYQLLDGIAQASGGLTLPAPADVPLFDHSVVQPDVLYFSAERRDLAADRIEGIPDLVVEVLSPGTARRDRDDKLALYARSGVREYWLIDPAERQIEFLASPEGQEGRYVVVLPEGGDYCSPVLPEIRLDIAAFWRSVQNRLRW
jgi:Uma2 family endonuclease